VGWGFRKSIKVGGAKVNLSKSGVGVSVGTKGARVGVSSKGNAYTSLGSHGVYHRGNLGSGKSSGSRQGKAQSAAWKGVYIVFLILSVVVLIAGLFSGSGFFIFLSIAFGLFMAYKLITFESPTEEFTEGTSLNLPDQPLPSMTVSGETWLCEKCQAKNPMTADFCRGCGEYR